MNTMTREERTSHNIAIAEKLKRKGYKPYALLMDNQPDTATIQSIVIVVGHSLYPFVKSDIILIPNPIAKTIQGKIRYILSGNNTAYTVMNDGTNVRFYAVQTDEGLHFQIARYNDKKECTYSATNTLEEQEMANEQRKKKRYVARFMGTKKPLQSPVEKKMRWRHNGKRHLHRDNETRINEWGVTEDSYILYKTNNDIPKGKL